MRLVTFNELKAKGIPYCREQVRRKEKAGDFPLHVPLATAVSLGLRLSSMPGSSSAPQCAIRSRPHKANPARGSAGRFSAHTSNSGWTSPMYRG